MSRHCEECCDIIFDALLDLCHNDENKCRNKKFPFQIESKVDYVTTQKILCSSKPMLQHLKILSRQCYSLPET